MTYVSQKVPSLYTALSAGSESTNPIIYGEASNAQIVNHNDIVEIVVNNFDTGGHPIHMHGHNFQMVGSSNFERYAPQFGFAHWKAKTK